MPNGQSGTMEKKLTECLKDWSILELWLIRMKDTMEFFYEASVRKENIEIVRRYKPNPQVELQREEFMKRVEEFPSEKIQNKPDTSEEFCKYVLEEILHNKWEETD